MKAINYVILVLLISVSVLSINAQVYVDGVTGKVGIGEGFDVTPPDNALDVNGDVNIMDGELLKDGEQVVFSTYNATEGNIALNTAIVASSTLDPQIASNAVDDDLVSYWSNAAVSTDEDLTITLTTESVISELIISAPSGSIFGTTVKISYSLNNTDWLPEPVLEITDAGGLSTATFTISPNANAKFVKIEMHNDVASMFAVSNITITGKEAIPEAAIWRKLRDTENNFTDNIIYDKGDVTIGANLGLKGWDDDSLKWIPKTMKLDWRGSLLFSRFLIQEPMVEGTVWNRGLISQNLKWNEEEGHYDIMSGGSNYPDFSAMIFENRGDIGFFTHDQSTLSNDYLTKEELETYRRMTITKEGQVKIASGLLQVGEEALTEATISNLKEGSGLWTTLLPDYIGTSNYVHLGSGLPCDECLLSVNGEITTEDLKVNQNFNISGNINLGTTLNMFQGENSGVPYDNTFADFTGNMYFRTEAGSANGLSTLGIQKDGTVVINTFPTYSSDVLDTKGSSLYVSGSILCEKVTIEADVPSSDYVFEEDYNLRSLEEVEEFIDENNHLPEVPSAEEFKENGYDIGEMDDLLLRKVEELTLYMIEHNKEVETLKDEVKKLQKENEVLKKKLKVK